MKNTTASSNRIRTALVGVALAGATVVGATGISSAVGAASNDTDDADIAALVGDTAAQVDDGTEVDPAERQARREARQEARQANRAEVAELLGLDAETLGEQLGDGTTLADVAEAQGVDVAAVVDLIVGQKSERLDAAVESGRLTQAEADEKAAEVADRVATRVEEGRPERGDGDGEGRRGGRRGGGQRDGAEAPAEG